LVFQAFSDLTDQLSPSRVVFRGEEKQPEKIISLHPHRSHYLLRLEGYRDRDSADQLRGELIYLRYEDVQPLPEGVYYHWQILGLPVFSTENEYLGVVDDIHETGANDVYVIKDEQGEELLLPAIELVIQEVDLDTPRLVVNLLPGLRGENN
jgi:16S rRNA processing protein RimM